MELVEYWRCGIRHPGWGRSCHPVVNFRDGEATLGDGGVSPVLFSSSLSFSSSSSSCRSSTAILNRRFTCSYVYPISSCFSTQFLRKLILRYFSINNICEDISYSLESKLSVGLLHWFISARQLCAQGVYTCTVHSMSAPADKDLWERIAMRDAAVGETSSYLVVVTSIQHLPKSLSHNWFYI